MSFHRHCHYMEFDKYSEVPKNVEAKIVEARGGVKEKERR